jgi:hypothetical protein
LRVVRYEQLEYWNYELDPIFNLAYMKRFIKILVLLAIIAFALYFANRFLFSGKSSYQSIYLVPDNAAWIIESDAPFDAWEKIVHSNAWKTLSHIESLAELNSDIREIDSVLRDKIFLLKAFANKKAMISIHEYSPGKFDYLYILNLGKITLLQNPEKIISSFLGSEYPITKRLYSGQTIYEMLDKESGEMYTFSFIFEKIIFSTNYKLIEASIDEMSKMRLGRNLDFIDVSKRVSGKGLFDLYINYSYFPGYMRWMLGKSTDKIDRLRKELGFSAFSFDISTDGMITLDGYTTVYDSVPSYYSTVLKTENGGFTSTAIIPARVASLVKISFDNASSFYKQSLVNLTQQDYDSFIDTRQKLEKKLKINIDENIISWIDNEIVLLQTQPSNLGRLNEFAAIIKAKNSNDARIQLEFIGKQIRKNTPVKVKEVSYEGYTIHYISFPGLVKALFGKMLEKIEKPYFTQIDEYVIFSNHPQTLKNIIDDYRNGNTLDNSEGYTRFTRQFDRRNSSYSYLEIPVLFNNLQAFVSADTWQKMNKNKPYITRFHQAGIQIAQKDELLHLVVKAEYVEQTENYLVPRFDGSFLEQFSGPDTVEAGVERETIWYDPAIQINDLDEKYMEEKDANGTVIFSVELKNGVKQGTYKAYYPDGSIKVNGKYKNDLKQGKWKYYDEVGHLKEEKEFEEGVEVQD